MRVALVIAGADVQDRRGTMNSIYEKPCLSCSIANQEIKSEGGEIARSRHFNVSQDFEYMIPGFMIVASNRHFRALDEMTKEESHDFIDFVIQVREAQRSVLNISDVYYFYNEDTNHHFHLWMIPRRAWMKAFGRSIEFVSPMLAHAKLEFVTARHRYEVAEASRKMKAFMDGRASEKPKAKCAVLSTSQFVGRTDS